ncbi:MAG: hypothetical protein ACM3ZT_07620 [Bacillota bacterium]
MADRREGKVAEARKLRRQGLSLKEIARLTGVSVATASTYCRGVLPKGKNNPDPRKTVFGEEVKRLYESGVPIPDIARRLKIPVPTLFDWRREMNLKRNSRRVYVTDALRRKIGDRLSLDREGQLAARAAQWYARSQLSTPEIGKKLGVSAATVGAWLEKAGIDRRKSPTARVREKLRLANLGSKRYNWKGGITGEQRRQRMSMYMREAREACFRRDDYTCRMCGRRGGKLSPPCVAVPAVSCVEV